MSSRLLFKILQIGGIFIFVVIVFVTILFAEGYQFDPKTRDLVKKSVMYFEGVKTPGSLPRVFLDGKAVTNAEPLELRVAPGIHEVKIESDGGFSWKKRVLIPEETVLRFPEIRLFPEAEHTLAKSIGSIKLLKYQSSGSSGIFFIHPKLHFGKFFSFEKPDTFWLQDIPFPANSIKLIPIDEDFWFGIGSEWKLFSYDPAIRQHFPRADFPVVDAKIYGETLFALDPSGNVWMIERDSDRPELLFREVSGARVLKRVEKENGRMLFVFDTLAVVTLPDGAIVFQEPQIDSATLDRDTIAYTKGGEYTRFDLREKKIISQRSIDTRVQFLSRIGSTFHFLFLTASHELTFCDEDYENCHLVEKIDPGIFEVSEDRMRFFASVNGELTMFNFELAGFVPQFLQNLVSFVKSV